jgi:hypothetical protein
MRKPWNWDIWRASSEPFNSCTNTTTGASWVVVLLIFGVEELLTLQWQRYLPSSITMASSSNPYEHYNSPQVEDEEDLIDPDDGMRCPFLLPGMRIPD